MKSQIEQYFINNYEIVVCGDIAVSAFAWNENKATHTRQLFLILTIYAQMCMFLR